MDLSHERLSIKQLLFSKAIPNHVISTPTAGYRVYACIDCGDKYLFQSSYEYHINRKSMEITYTCRFCNYITHTFYNRCNLLAHIRNHAFKTATINLSDLKVQPLPLQFFKTDSIKNTVQELQPTVSGESNATTGTSDDQDVEMVSKQTRCQECNDVIGNSFRHRAKHFMGLTKNIFTCPLCLFVLPTLCAFKSHIRIHVRSPPYFCPECGVILRTKALYYPYNHDCEGFKMMRVNARLKCPLPNCTLYHPSEHKEHMENCHIKKVYKCSFCVVASFSKQVMEKHVATHNAEVVPLIFYQCELCPGRLVKDYQYKKHIKCHLTFHVFPCRSCSAVFKEVPTLLQHYCNKHATKNMSDILQKILSDSEEMYHVTKRCEKCSRSFRYKCKFSNINSLPTNCPYNCYKSPEAETTSNTVTEKTNIICHLCKVSISDNWSDIKAHYASQHKSFKCLDLKLNIPRTNLSAPKLESKRVQQPSSKMPKRMKKIMRRRLRRKFIENEKRKEEKIIELSDSDKLVCKVCAKEFSSKISFQEHLLIHKDAYMAYQCMECGKCFVVKPSFSTHLLLEHQISDADAYIEEKKCFNQDALIKNDFSPATSKEPVKENQCNICLEQFDNCDNLEKHYRVHGMAFLIKNKSKSP